MYMGPHLGREKIEWRQIQILLCVIQATSVEVYPQVASFSKYLKKMTCSWPAEISPTSSSCPGFPGFTGISLAFP